MDRRCARCGSALPAQPGRGRPRKYCQDCQPQRPRANPHLVEISDGNRGDNSGESELVRSYRQQLEAAERLHTPEGATVMHLAKLFAADSHTASGAASLSRELRAAMEVALRGAPTQADALDELADRRRAKASGA